MAFIQAGNPATGELAVEPGTGAARVAIVPRGTGFGVSATSGIVGATLAANASVFAMRLDPGATKRAFIERIRLEFTTIAAFTTPITAGRRLVVSRGSGAATSGGTSIPAPAAKHGIADTSEFSIANGGDIRIATTAALTVTGITFETSAFRELGLTHVGAAGGFRDLVWEFAAAESQAIQLDPGQILAIRNGPNAMDAAGTFQLTVCVDWYEAPAMDSTA